MRAIDPGLTPAGEPGGKRLLIMCLPHSTRKVCVQVTHIKEDGFEKMASSIEVGPGKMPCRLHASERESERLEPRRQAHSAEDSQEPEPGLPPNSPNTSEAPEKQRQRPA